MRDADVIQALRAALAVPTGRHLYGVLGRYAALDRFAAGLQRSGTIGGQPFPPPLSVNRGVLAAIPDEEFRRLVTDEAKFPEPVRAHVRHAFDAFLRASLTGSGPVVLAHLELLFAYAVDLSLLRTLATDADKVILLLPGRREGGRVILFTEAGDSQATLPDSLIAANHLWGVED